jgi:hypothetical protein
MRQASCAACSAGSRQTPAPAHAIDLKNHQQVWYYNRMKHKVKPAVRKMKQALSHHHRQGAAALRSWSSGGGSWRGSKEFRTATTVEGDCVDCEPLGDAGKRDGEGGLGSCPDGRPDGPDKC